MQVPVPDAAVRIGDVAEDHTAVHRTHEAVLAEEEQTYSVLAVQMPIQQGVLQMNNKGKFGIND